MAGKSQSKNSQDCQKLSNNPNQNNRYIVAKSLKEIRIIYRLFLANIIDHQIKSGQIRGLPETMKIQIKNQVHTA